MNQGKSSLLRLARRSSQDNTDTNPISYKIKEGPVPNFFDVREHVFHVVKPWSWIKNANKALQSAESKTTLISKQMPNLNMGIIYGLYTNGDDENVRYVSSSDLLVWKRKEKDLNKYAKQNLLDKIESIEKNRPLFIETQTGIYYTNELNYLTSSLLAVPEVFNKVSFKITQNFSYIVLCPAPNLLLVTHSHDTRGLCLIAEICLRFTKKDSAQSVTSIKPIRVTKGNLTIYEPSVVKNESHWPTNEDEINTCKKTIVKKSKKSIAHKTSK